MRDWNSALYLKFEHERTQAALDLLAKIPDIAPKSIVDLGCGPGNSTQLLRQRFPQSAILGLDHSQNMLEVARARVSDAEFVQQNIETWQPHEKIDLIYANAALQFVPDHHQLMVRLLSYLTEGGCLAVQMPDNMQEMSHALMRMISADGPWAQRLVPIAKTRAIIGPPEDYCDLLTPHCSHVTLWQTAYVHPLEGPESIVEWFEGSALQPFLAPLNAEEREAFLARYRAELLQAYTRQRDGKVLLRYPRLFFIAQK